LSPAPGATDGAVATKGDHFLIKQVVAL